MTELFYAPRMEMGESTMGYLLRLANGNGFFGLSEFKAAVNQVTRCQDLRKITRVNLVSITGYGPLDVLNGLSSYYDPVNRHHYFYLDEWDSPYLPREFINYRGPRICPHCIAEAGYIRHSWDFALQTHCVKHGLLLQDRCPSCRSFLNWGRPRLLKCKCGTELSNFAVVKIPDVISEFHWLMFRYRFGVDRVPRLWMQGWPEWFQELSTEQVARGIIGFTYTSLFEGRRLPNRTSEAGLRMEDLLRGIAAIMGILKTDPIFAFKAMQLVPGDIGNRANSKGERYDAWRRNFFHTEQGTGASLNFIFSQIGK